MRLADTDADVRAREVEAQLIDEEHRQAMTGQLGRKNCYLTGTNSSPHVHRYGSPAPGQWHSASMRTRHPQPAWPHVNSVPFS